MTDRLTLDKIDGSQFLYNPKDDNDLKKLEKLHEDFNFPLKSGLKVFKKTILRYIILQYDKHTPLRTYYSNYYKRKMHAALLAGFQRNAKTGRFANAVKEVLTGENEDVNKAIVRYVMQFFDNDFLMLSVWTEFLGKKSAELMEGGDKFNKSNFDAIQGIRKEIDKLTEKVFGGRESTMIEQELYKAIDVEKEALHPDYVANYRTDNPEYIKELVNDQD